MEERLLVKETAKLQASFEGSRSRRWCWFGQTLNEDRVFVQGRVSLTQSSHLPKIAALSALPVHV